MQIVAFWYLQKIFIFVFSTLHIICQIASLYYTALTGDFRPLFGLRLPCTDLKYKGFSLISLGDKPLLGDV